MSSVRVALLISFFLSNGITVLQFISSLIVARLLSPREIGVYSIAAAIIAIAQLFRNVGVANYLVSETDLTYDKIRAAFGVQLVTSWILGLLVFASSWLVAGVYRENGIREVMAIASISFILAPFGGVTLTLLLREMRYRERAIVDVSSAMVHATLSVSLAYAGLGYMSLAWAALGNTITTVCVAAVFRPVGLPWLPNFREARNVLSFSLPTAGADILRYFRAAIPELVVGRVIGLEAVAFLSRATGIIGLFNSVLGQSVSRVAFAYFPQQQRSGENLKYVFLKAFDYLCVTAVPFFITLAIMADPVVMVLFGSQWRDSIILVQIISCAALIATPFSVTSLMLNAMGHSRDIFGIEFIVFVAIACLIYPAALSANEAVGWVMVIVALVNGVCCYRKLRTVLMVSINDIALAFVKVFPVVVSSVSIPIVIQYFCLFDSEWVTVLFGGIGATIGWVVSVMFCKHSIYIEIRKIINYGCLVFKKYI